MEARAVVRARWNSSGSSETLSGFLRNDAPRMGLYVFQTRRQFLGRNSRRTLSRRQSHGHLSLPPRYAGYLARRRRQLHPRMQSSDLAIVRCDPRFAQFERHQAELGSHYDNRAPKPPAKLAERPALVERS